MVGVPGRSGGKRIPKPGKAIGRPPGSLAADEADRVRQEVGLILARTVEAEAMAGGPLERADIREIAKIHSPRAMHVLIAIAEDERHPASARVSAAQSIVDRGYGKAPQAITGPEGGPIEVKVVDEVAMVARLAVLLGVRIETGEEDDAGPG